MSPFWFAVVVWIAAPAAAAGLETMDGMPVEALFPEARFDPAIPTQREVLGFEPGARPLRHDEILRYLRALDEASPRAKLVEYARSHEGRELVYFAIAEPGTIAELDSFREEHARRADPRARSAEPDRAQGAPTRAVAWIAYGIHGDELSSSDAAVAVAYRLVAGEDELAERLRRELVILIDPLENPDGRDRFLAQTRSFAHAKPNADVEDLSHTTVWPWGRGNHYLFDLNRDWFTMVQPESRRSEVIASWNPQLVVDSHEMGSDDTYLFSPARHPFNPFLPATHVKWGERFAAEQARALDRHGYPYYTREWNEEFFPGYGSSWASYSGAIGILYEMSGTEGTLVKNQVGRVRTYPQAVHHQATSTIANLTTLAAHRAEVLADYEAHRRRAMIPERVAAWLLPRGAHPERTDRLAELLERQGIEVLESRSDSPAIAGAIDARTGRAPQAVASSGAYLVRLDQPLSPLARQLLDPHVPMNAEFFREEREYLERGKGTRLYEVTAWSLPLAYDVEAYWMKTAPAAAGWAPAEIPPAAGELIAAEAAPFGFLIDGITDRSLPLLAGLLVDGIRVQVAEKPFQVGGRTWPRASLLVIAEGHPADLAERLREAARRHGVDIHAVPTAKTENGPDLGGGHFKPLVAPRVGVWAGWPVSPSEFGALWHLFDQELDLRFNALDLGRFGSIDLARYNVLIFPPAFGEGYSAAIGDDGVKRLRSWIEAGGTVIGIGSGTEFLASADLELTRTRLRSEALEDFPPVVLGPSAERAERGGPFRAAGLRAPEPDDEDEDEDAAKTKTKDEKKKKPAKVDAKEPASPYDVAPILGDGARPFAEGHDAGTPVDPTPVDLARWVEPLLPPGKDEPELEDLERADARLRAFSPQGAFLRVELDPEAWLGWGLGPELPALATASDTLVAASPVDVAARFADLPRLHLGGLLWPEAAGRLARTAYATRESRGNGQIVLFLESPEFRGVTLGTRRLLVNAVLYGPGLGTRWSRPW